MGKLTEKEIETFERIVRENTPILEKVLQNKRELLKFLRSQEMTDLNLNLLEKATESACKIYLVKKAWDEIEIDELYMFPDENLCEYVRTVIKIFKNAGGGLCAN